MSFGIEKCTDFAMKRHKEAQCKGIDLGNEFGMVEVDEMGYKYWDIEEKAEACQEEFKASVTESGPVG